MADSSSESCPVIVGPTAVGKTALIGELAARLPLEVISLDSRQIYRGLRIGTAQPTAAEQATCPHHLIDFLSPEDKYDAMRFRRDFERVHQEIVERGGVPVLVGGAGMYLTALQEGFMEVPGSSPAALATVRGEQDLLSDEEIRSRLQAVDPRSYGRIHTNDRYRSQRALEVFTISGRTMTELMAAQQPDPCLGLSFPTFVLTRPVAELDAQIARRTESMLKKGWIEETEAALAQHPADCPGLQSLGYREIVQFLQGKLPKDELAPSIIRVTRQYAKRQRTWFRQVERVGEGDSEEPDTLLSLGELLAKMNF